MKRVLVINHVGSGSLASQAGLMVGDVIESYNSVSVQTSADLDRAVEAASNLDKVIVRIVRSGRSEVIALSSGALGIRASTEAEGVVNSVVVGSQSGLVKTLNVFSWLILGFGAIFSIIVFSSTAMMSGVYGTYYNIFGFAYTAAAVFHTALAFVVLKVLVKIATDIEAMRG